MNSALCPQLSLIALMGICLSGFGDSPIAQTNSIGMNMVRLEAGSFQMGARMSGQTDRFSFPFSRSDDLVDVPPDWDEFPRHKVSISKPFFISRTEVTEEQYRKFKPDYRGSETYGPYATGISWYEALAFCRWLSEKEGKPYRLPTEAEWEYACRAGTDTPFSSGDQPPEPGSPNPWDLLNMHSGVLEWCLDWHGLYPHEDQVDPVGSADGFTRVVRGGPLDRKDRMLFRLSSYYRRSTNRAGIAPGFGQISSGDDKNGASEENSQVGDDDYYPGLMGIMYSNPYLIHLSDLWPAKVINSDRMNWPALNDWSVVWRGFIEAPITGSIDFSVETNKDFRLEIDDQVVIDGWLNGTDIKGAIELEKGRKYPLKVSFSTAKPNSFLHLLWSYSGQKKVIVPATAFLHTKPGERLAREEVLNAKRPRENPVGFRVVQASMPTTQPLRYEAPFVRQGVRQYVPEVKKGPRSDQPYFRKRMMLPIPLENSSREVIDAAGFHPSFRGHNHSPALEVCSNGDLLLVIFTSYDEYEPGMSLMAARLRYGQEEWDMPSPLMNFPDVSVVSPLLWNEGEKLLFFWGSPQLDGGFPFQWTTSYDNAASFEEVKFPVFHGPVLPHSRQPINSAFRGLDGTIYVASDGEGGTSVLWASRDEGQTWHDTEGRSGGRHTTFVQLKNGDILGMGGKNTNIDGFMPKSISADGGKTWEVSRTPFSALASNQRPTIIRLQSGRLFFASDFQKRRGGQPEGITQKGAFAALSEDEGETWKVKKIPGTLPHEVDDPSWGGTLGYAVARQAPNGIIHLITTMNQPSLHFAMNEAWILSEEKSDTEKDSANPEVGKVKRYAEHYSNGKTRIEGGAGFAEDGRYLMDGVETWWHANGRKKWEVTFRNGRKTDQESYWNLEGKLVWQWDYKTGGSSQWTWTQWWPNGQLKSQSEWKNGKCEGVAKTWDYSGKLISEVKFSDGKPIG